MTSKAFRYLKKRAMYCVLILIILGTVGCSGINHHIDSFPIMPMLDSEEIAQLTSDEQSIVKYLATKLLEEKKIEAEARGKKYAYYFKVLGKNPDPTILMNLQDERVKLKPASAGRLRADMVYDPEVDWVELYSIIRIEIAGEAAKVEVSFYLNPLSAIGYEYRLVRKDSTWEFVGSKWLWIS
jgi:hypothetical protein